MRAPQVPSQPGGAVKDVLSPLRSMKLLSPNMGTPYVSGHTVKLQAFATVMVRLRPAVGAGAGASSADGHELHVCGLLI